MTYQKPINPQRFDQPYEQLRPKKKTERTVRPRKKQNERRTTARSGSKKSGATEAQPRARALNRSK